MTKRQAGRDNSGQANKERLGEAGFSVYTKMREYRACVPKTLLFGGVAWIIYSRQGRYFNMFHMLNLRCIKVIGWQDRVTKNEVLAGAQISCFSILQQQRRLQDWPHSPLSRWEVSRGPLLWRNCPWPVTTGESKPSLLTSASAIWQTLDKMWRSGTDRQWARMGVKGSSRRSSQGWCTHLGEEAYLPQGKSRKKPGLCFRMMILQMCTKLIRKLWLFHFNGSTIK